MKRFFFIICISFYLSSCGNENSKLPNGFVYLDEIIPEIEIDLRYFSNNNFVGDTINGYKSERCIISFNAAESLKKINTELNKQGLGLKVFDAYRPQQAVDHFVKWANNLNDTLTNSIYYPEVNKNELFAKGYIAKKSGHSRGSTIDLTIIYLDGENKNKELDMGSGWDFLVPNLGQVAMKYQKFKKITECSCKKS